MEHIDGIGQACGLDHAVCARVVPHSKFLDAFANAGHRLEVVRLLTALHLIKLVAGIVPGILGKLPQRFERVAEEPKQHHVSTISIWI